MNAGIQVNNWLKNIQYWLYPAHCLLCGAANGSERPLCEGCLADLGINHNTCPGCAIPLPEGVTGLCGACQRRHPPFDGAIAPFLYQPPLDRLLLDLKFNNRLQHAQLLGDLMAERLLKDSDDLPGLLIPVPLHRSRIRQRGYNQALELARSLGGRLEIAVDSRSCLRVRETASQSQLSARERSRNIRNAFQMEKPIQAAHVAIIDDVMTTGSTVAELARVLKRSGVERVEVWVCARADVGAKL